MNENRIRTGIRLNEVSSSFIFAGNDQSIDMYIMCIAIYIRNICTILSLMILIKRNLIKELYIRLTALDIGQPNYS